MGRIEEKIEENKTKGKSLKIQCSNCNRKTGHLIFQSIDTPGSELIDQQYSVDWANHYQIVQCQGYVKQYLSDISIGFLSIKILIGMVQRKGFTLIG